MKKQIIILLWILLVAGSGYSATKKILIDIFTGTWCPNCASEGIVLDSVLSVYPENFIFSFNHNSDPMSNRYGSADLIDIFHIIDVPSCRIDRKNVNQPAASAFYLLSSNVVKVLKNPSPVSINLKPTWDVATRKIGGSVSVKFESTPQSGDFRIGLIIIQDKVVGGESSFWQKNAYNTVASGEGKYTQLLNKGSPIEGYVHRFVERDYPLKDIHGKSGIIPDTPVVGTDYSMDIDYTVPEKYIGNSGTALSDSGQIAKPENIYIVAYVQLYKGEVLNSEIKPILDGTIAMRENLKITHSLQNCKVDIKNRNILLEVKKAGNYAVSMYNLTGQRIFDYPRKTMLPNSYSFSLPENFNMDNSFIVAISDEKHTITQHFLMGR
jgi:thiol-disulfide isomerase/thioredoxin